MKNRLHRFVKQPADTETDVHPRVVSARDEAQNLSPKTHSIRNELHEIRTAFYCVKHSKEEGRVCYPVPKGKHVGRHICIDNETMVALAFSMVRGVFQSMLIL